MSSSGLNLDLAILYGILDLGYVRVDAVEATTRALIEGGVDVLQLRAKGHGADAIEAMARQVQPICHDAAVPFIVNDFPEIAARVGADGVHLGQDDGPLAAARATIRSALRAPRSALLFGRSTHSPEQAAAAVAEGFDYIGFGPLFPTPTKLGRPGIGLDDVAEVQDSLACRLPVFCIGGIKRSKLPEVVAAGTRRAVLVSDLLTAPDIRQATAEARQLLSAERGAGSAE